MHGVFLWVGGGEVDLIFLQHDHAFAGSFNRVEVAGYLLREEVECNSYHGVFLRVS